MLLQALTSLSKDDIIELKSVAQPPALVQASAYVSIRQYASACVSICLEYVSIRQYT